MKRKRVQRRKGPQVERVLPTPETLAKLQPDPFYLRLTTGKITAEQWQAGVEIREAVKMITGAVGVRISQFERRSRGHDEFESERQIRVQRQYNDWCDLMTARKLMIGVVLDYLIEERSFNDIAKARHMWNIRVRRMIEDGLSEYVAMMGWKVAQRA